MSLSTLKRNRGDLLKNLVSQVEKTKTSNDYSDDRFWKPTRDAAGNGYAEIRFLPPVTEEAAPFVRYWDHFFKGPTGRYYIEKSLTTFGEDDPVSKYNSELWNADDNPNSPLKEQARKQKRKLHHISNIYVISDPANPENNGKVFLYDYGKKVFDKIMNAIEPQFDDEKPMNPFDLWEGGNFKIKIRQVEGWPNYEMSSFTDPKPLSSDDDELNKIYSQVYPLSEFIDRSKYKSYSELQTQLNMVLGKTGGNQSLRDEVSAPSMKEAKPSYEDEPEPEEYWGNDYKLEEEPASGTDDETMDYFNKLLEED